MSNNVFSVAAPFLVEGEGVLEVLDGAIEVFGISISAGEEIFIPQGKVFPCIVSGSAKIRCKGCRIRIPKTEVFPRKWFEALDIIRKMLKEAKVGPLRIIVIGYVDVGKSSFILYTANKLIELGYKVGLIDADIGQAKLGPPGVISGAILDKQLLDLSAARILYAYFIGDKSPLGHLLPCIVGVRRILDMISNKCDVVFIDTTGLVFGGPGLALKRYKIEIVEPHVIFIIEKGKECEHIARSAYVKTVIMRIPAPKTMRPTPRDARILLRKKAIMNFLKKCNEWDGFFSFDRVVLQNTSLHSGVPIENPQSILGNSVVWAELSANVFLIVLRKDAFTSIKEEIYRNARRFLISLKTARAAIMLGGNFEEWIKSSPFLSSLSHEKVSELINIIERRKFDEISIAVIPEDFYENLYVGLLDRNLGLIGVGILREIDFENKRLKIRSFIMENRSIDEAAVIRFGYLKFNENWEEMGRRKVGLL